MHILDFFLRDLSGWIGNPGIGISAPSPLPCEKRILEKHFDVGDHLSMAEGKALFTRLLAEKMGPVMKKMVDL